MDASEYERMHGAEARLWWFRALHTNLLSLLNRYQPAASGRVGALPVRVLDAGCGTGGWLQALGRARPDLARTGLEYDARAAGYAEGKAGCRIVVGTINALPFDAGTFDLVTSADVLCHAGVDQDAALTELHRVLAADGRLILNLPAYRWLMSYHDAKVHNARRYGTAEVAALLRRHRFEPDYLGHWNCFLFPLMALRRLVGGLVGGLGFGGAGAAASDVSVPPAPVNWAFRQLCRIETGLIGRGLRLPFGGSIIVVARKI